MSIKVSLFDVPHLNTKDGVIDITKFVTLLFGDERDAKVKLGVQKKLDEMQKSRIDNEKSEKAKIDKLKEKANASREVAMAFIAEFASPDLSSTEKIQKFLQTSSHAKSYKKHAQSIAAMVAECTSTSENEKFATLMKSYLMKVQYLTQQDSERDFNFLSIMFTDDNELRVSGEGRITTDTHAEVIAKKIQALMDAQRTKEE